MKPTYLISFALCILFFTQSFSQKIKGIATYKVQTKMDIQLDSTMDRAMQEQIHAMLKKQSQKEFELQFTENESQYKQNETLGAPSTKSSGGYQVMVVESGGGSNKLYKNLKENNYSNQQEFFGKQFLIKDTIEKREWKLEKETKYIGEYPCFKATYMGRQKVMNMVSSENNDKEESKSIKEEKEMLVTAWYTPQIPVQTGPEKFGGLPGLILEVNTENKTFLCSKIVLNPEKGVDIKEPTNGKVVNDAEYKEIVEKKLDEMQRNSGGRAGGTTIRFGG